VRTLAAISAVLLAQAALARADSSSSSVTVTLTPAGEQLAMSLGDGPDIMKQKVLDKINATYQTLRIGALLDAFTATTEFANHGLGVDYATRPGERMVGAVFAGALTSDSSFYTAGHLTTGVIVNFAVMGGANLARWDHPRWSVFANAFYEAGSFRALDGHLLTLGAHVQYRLVQPTPPGNARWTGVDVTSGLELSRWTLSNSAPIVSHLTVQGSIPGESRNLELNANGTLSLVATTFTIPIELTTGVTLLDVLGLYAGGGIDVTAGTSTVGVNLDGELTITQDGTDVGHAVIQASGDRTASPLAAHVLAGLQINAPHFHFVLQGLATPAVYGVNVAMRVTF
jgi:hypothetical protein